MTYRSFITFTATLVLLSGTFAITSCGKTTSTSDTSTAHVHEKNTLKWQYDDTYHWHPCVNCDEGVFDKENHRLEIKNGKKCCSTCLFETESSDEENFLVFKEALDFALSYDGAYSTEVESEDENGKKSIKESYLDDGLFYCKTEEYEKNNPSYFKEQYTVGVQKIDNRYIFFSNSLNYNEEKGQYDTYMHNTYVDELFYQTVQRNSPKSIENYNEFVRIRPKGETFKEYQDYLNQEKERLNKYRYYDALKNVDTYTFRIDETSAIVGYQAVIESSNYNEALDDTITTRYEVEDRYTVMNNRIVLYKRLVTKTQLKSDGSSNGFEIVQQYQKRFNYSKNQEWYDSFDPQGKDNIYEGYGSAYFYYGNTRIKAIYPSKIGSNIDTSLQDLFRELKIDENARNAFEFYLDPEFKVPYQNEPMTSLGMNLYVKLNCPENKTILVVEERGLYSYPDDYPESIEKIFYENSNQISHIVVGKPGTYDINNYLPYSYQEIYVDGIKIEKENNQLDLKANQVCHLLFQSKYN